MTDEQRKICEDLGWEVYETEDDIELRKCSSLGEDFGFSLFENDGEVTEFRFPKLPSDRAFRNVVVEELWDNLTDVPIDPETEELDEPYYIWPKGTDKEDIWHWFDEHHSKGVAYLLGFAD